MHGLPGNVQWKNRDRKEVAALGGEISHSSDEVLQMQHLMKGIAWKQRQAPGAVPALSVLGYGTVSN